MPHTPSANPPAAAAFPALWAQVRPQLLGYLVSATGDFHDAEDLLQRVAVALLDKLAEYDPERPFGAFAMGIAKFEVLRFRRETARDRLRFGEEVIGCLADAFARIEGDADARLEALPDCLDVLAPKAKEALRLVYQDDLNGDAAAEKLKTSTGNLFSMLSRARAQVRRCVELKLKS